MKGSVCRHNAIQPEILNLDVNNTKNNQGSFDLCVDKDIIGDGHGLFWLRECYKALCHDSLAVRISSTCCVVHVLQQGVG